MNPDDAIRRRSNPHSSRCCSADGREDSIGWFVGWVRKDARTLVFARLPGQPARADRYGGPLTRDAFLSKLARSSL